MRYSILAFGQHMWFLACFGLVLFIAQRSYCEGVAEKLDGMLRLVDNLK